MNGTRARAARAARTIALAGTCLIMADGLPAAETQTDVDVRYGHATDAGRTVQAGIDLEPRIEFAAPRGWQVRLSSRLRLDAANRLEPGDAVTDTYAPPSRPLAIGNTGLLELRDAYLERRLANGLVRIGKQQIVWGRLDGVKVLDVLNPQDFREFILDDFDKSRIGLWSAYVDLAGRNWRGEFVAIVDNSGHAIPQPGAWFELTAPRFRFGAAPGEPGVDTVTSKRPVGADTGALAARLSRRVGPLDLAALAYTGIDFEPLGRFAELADDPVVERYYERRDLVGLSAEGAAGRIAFRAELAYQPGRHFNTRSGTALDAAALDQLTAGIGIDVDGPFGVFVNLQLIHDEVRDAPASLVRPARDQIGTVVLRRSFRYETLTATARWYHARDPGDSMVSLALEFKPGDNTRLRLAADGFSGDPRGLFGQFLDRDRVTLQWLYTF